jgi:hypothetical protein
MAVILLDTFISCYVPHCFYLTCGKLATHNIFWVLDGREHVITAVDASDSCSGSGSAFNPPLQNAPQSTHHRRRKTD